MPHDNRSAFIATRLTEAQRAKIQRAAKACNETLSTFTRQALTARAAGDLGAANEATASRVRLSSNPARLAIKHLVALVATDPVDPTDALAQLCLALGLPRDADAKTIQAAVDALLATVGGGDAGADPLESNPDLAPTAPTGGRTVKTSRGKVTLSAREVKACAEAGAKIEEYAENKAIRAAARPWHPPPTQRAPVAAKFEIGPDGNVRLARR